MSNQKRELLGGISAKDFLTQYWQKKPYFIRQAIPDFQNFISKDDLFSLACNQEIESRLVIEKGGDYPWQVIHGPFINEDFEQLSTQDWTLLVHNLNRYVTKATEMLKQFDFIPSWRIDDLMVSYASRHGSVGAHLDSYDVFLFQAAGVRRWQINFGDYSEEDFIPGLDLRIIDKFNPDNEWLLEPGDMLYLPPGIAHHGVADDHCMTYSIGFRAPSRHELLSHYVDHHIQHTTDLRYTDADLTRPDFPGEITVNHLQKIKQLLQSFTDASENINKWFGCFITTIHDQIEIKPPSSLVDSKTFLTLFAKHELLYRHKACRTAFIREKEELLLFVNGEVFSLANAYQHFVYDFSGVGEINYKTLAANALGTELIEILCRLYNEGMLHFNN